MGSKILKSRQFLLKLLNCSNLLNLAIWKKKCALALNQVAKIKPGQIERSVFFPPGCKQINRNLRVVQGQSDVRFIHVVPQFVLDVVHKIGLIPTSI